MVGNNSNKRAKERLRCVFAFFICLMTTLLFSYESSQKDFFAKISSPIEFLKMEQENQFQKLFTKFFAPEIPERFKKK